MLRRICILIIFIVKCPVGVSLPTVPVRERFWLMLCICPFRPRKGVEFGCGQCLPCRINRRRMWTARLVLEAASHATPSTFLTLTYAPECLPVGGTLVPKDLEEFRYKLRFRIGPFRYYFIGEYGEFSNRPHYHGLVFGFTPTVEQMLECWPYGLHHVGFFSTDSAAYCAGYVTKKMTKKDDLRLEGRYPEFARMSRKPGLGARGLEGIIRWLYTSEGATYIGRYHDVPLSVRFDGKVYPLGRYLVTRMREEFGIASSDPVRQAALRQRQDDLAVPEIAAARELAREGNYQRAHFYIDLRKSKAKL